MWHKRGNFGTTPATDVGHARAYTMLRHGATRIELKLEDLKELTAAKNAAQQQLAAQQQAAAQQAPPQKVSATERIGVKKQ